MLRFYRNSFFVFLSLVLLSAGVVYLGLARSRVHTNIYPNDNASLTWVPSIEPLQPHGDTWLRVKRELGVIEYEYHLDEQQQYPYTHYAFTFVNEHSRQTVADLSAFHRLSFKITCAPRNVLLAVLFTFDDKVTQIDAPKTRRVSSLAFECDGQWREKILSFGDFVTPDWWLEQHGHKFSDRAFSLEQAMGIAFVNSMQSPHETTSTVRVRDIRLDGERPWVLNATGGAILFLWLAALVGLFFYYTKALTAKLKEKVRQDQPLIAYKKLSIEPQKDKEKDALFRYVATEYARADLSLEVASHALGINRTKINELLKEELGLTFTAYLNKLRLTEAARLLAEKGGMNISEIAYSVGYNNVSYFNKLFKKEYNCTPKTFKNLSSPPDWRCSS